MLHGLVFRTAGSSTNISRCIPQHWTATGLGRHSLMPLRAKGGKTKLPDTSAEDDGVYIGVNRGQRCEFKTCQQCQRPMNRRAKWSDDATWAAVRYCSDKCRKEAKRKPVADPGTAE